MSAEEQAPPANQFENMSGNNSSGAAENASAQSGAAENASAQSGAAENASAQSGAAENASAQSGAAENASAQSGAAENASAQSGAAENASIAPPAVEKNVSASPPKPPAAAPISAPVAPLSTSGYVMSQKAKDLQARRKALLTEMQAEYTKVFGDDKKAPKAKAYHAAGLLTIKERDGNAAYQSKLQEYIAENQRKFQGKTAKAPKAPKVSSAMSLPASAPKNVSVKSGNSHSAAVRSIEAMGASINTMVEKMIAKAKSLGVAPAANSAHSHSSKKRKVRSNKGGTHKHRKPAYKPYVNE